MSNVLVYSGPGVSASALSHTLRTLRRLLPSYDVQCINAQSLALDPWMDTTSLLVLPGGRDLPYVEKLSEAHYLPAAAVAGQSGGSSSRVAHADARIREYVMERGGTFLGICAGAYYASSTCEFEQGDPVMEVIGSRPALQFFPGTCQGTVYPGFVYESDEGARLVSLAAAGQSQPYTTYYNGGGAFIDAENYQNQGVTVIARYVSEEAASQAGAAAASRTHSIKDGYAGQASVVLCHAGDGRALLYGTHPEFPVIGAARPMQLSGAPEAASATTASFEELERHRLATFGSHLQLLGLQVEGVEPTADAVPAPKLAPVILAAREPSSVSSVISVLLSAASPLTETNALGKAPQHGHLLSIVDVNDTLHVYDEECAAEVFETCANADYAAFVAPVTTPANVDEARAGQAAEPDKEVDLHRVPKYVIAVRSGSSLRGRGFTPHWDLGAFFEHAEESRSLVAELCAHEGWATTAEHGGFAMQGHSHGESLRIADVTTYAQVVTSTQTMLDKNYKLLTRLPSGLTSFATHQVSGRGRGKNAWISPLGCLQFSTLLRVPDPQRTLWHAGMGGIVFVQYLAGLAIVESVRGGALGRDYAAAIGSKLRIKWPNDVYAQVQDEDDSASCRGKDSARKGTFVWRGKRYAKMAGVLVNTQFAGSELALVVGCGINTLNARPTTSLSDLIEAHNSESRHKSGVQGAGSVSPPPLAVVSQERFAGAILATFERMWNTFVAAGGSFVPFVDAYRRAWLHS